MEFVPYKRAFWAPIGYGLVAGLLTGGLGYATYKDLFTTGAWFAIGFAFVWLPCMISWQRLVMQLEILHHQARLKINQPAPEKEPEQSEELLFYVTCAEIESTQHVLRDLPLDPSTMQAYAQGVANGKRLVFSEWIGPGKLWGSARPYTAMLEWMRAQRYVIGEPGDTVVLTEKGKHFLRDLAQNGIQLYSPTAAPMPALI